MSLSFEIVSKNADLHFHELMRSVVVKQDVNVNELSLVENLIEYEWG
jgi:hypothetical protein